MRKWFWLLFLFVGTTYAQAEPLTAENIDIVEGVGDFGQPTLSAVGEIVNASADSAFANLSITAQAYDVGGTLVGEGVGFLVNQCDVGLPFDFALQPDSRQTFAAPLELFEVDAEIERVEVLIDGETVEPVALMPDIEGITRLSDQEIASVEWDAEGQSFLFGVGCRADLFTEWEWSRYDVAEAEITPETHPRAALVTEDLAQRLGLDALFFARSMLTYAPGGDRLVFQDEINDLLTAAPEGRFQRLLFNDQHNRTLQGVHWLPEERFLAYYFGAYGDPVLYYTATAEGQRISPQLDGNPESEIVPGASADGRRIVFAGTVEDERGYFLYVTSNNFIELLFQAEPPGNNYPPPIPLVDPESDLVNRVYTALDMDGENRLVCFNRDTGDLHDLALLPLDLQPDDRAAWWIAPDEQTIALGVTGANGGLWLIDLAALPSCE